MRLEERVDLVLDGGDIRQRLELVDEFVQRRHDVHVELIRDVRTRVERVADHGDLRPEALTVGGLLDLVEHELQAFDEVRPVERLGRELREHLGDAVDGPAARVQQVGPGDGDVAEGVAAEVDRQDRAQVGERHAAVAAALAGSR